MLIEIKHLYLFLLAFTLIGCSSLQSNSRTKNFSFSRSWARHTLNSEYLGARINHTMQPLLHEDLVIQGNEWDGISAYQHKLGFKKWHRAIQGGVTSSSVKILNGVIYFGAGDGFFYALDAKTGQTKWSFPITSEGLGSPLVYEDMVYFMTGNNAVYALKAENGEQVWFYNRTDGANITVRGASEPSAMGDTLFLGFSDGYLVALDRTKGTFKWEKLLNENVRFKDVDSKPVLDGGQLYVSSYDGSLYCLNAKNGEVIWTTEEGGFTPVTIVQNTLYYATSSGQLRALEKSSGKVLWTKELKSTVAGQPIVHRGLVIFGEWSGSLRALDQLNGKEIASFNTGRGVTSTPALSEKLDYIYVMTVDANLFAVKLNLSDRIGEWAWER